MERTQDLNVVSLVPLMTPNELKAALPMSETANATIVNGRRDIQAILDGHDDRFVGIVGPCSIHDEDVALDYAARLARLQDEVRDTMVLVMRAYFEKPRTVIGWKGLINDPTLDGTYNIAAGIHRAREVLLRIAETGVPTATELLDPIVPQYIADLVTWVSIGARTTESQTHREMASGLSMPVGFKNSTDGNLQVALDALQSARHPHHFLGIDQDGRTSIVATRGNPYGHIVLRGGRGGPNYDPVSIAQTEEQLARAGLPARILVDCSHANSGKQPHLQRHVLRSVLQQRLDGNASIIGFLIESNIHGGRQDLPKRGEGLQYGVSITDACMSWDDTEQLLRFAHQELVAGPHQLV
jgi:3-deoxy-7-phosphoheptulonate synthase